MYVCVWSNESYGIIQIKETQLLHHEIFSSRLKNTIYFSSENFYNLVKNTIVLYKSGIDTWYGYHMGL